MQEWSYVCGHFWDEEVPFITDFTAYGTVRKYPQGSYLLQQGGRSAQVMLILDGCVETGVALEDGRKKVHLIYTGRVVLGMSSLTSSESGMATRCLTPVTAVTVDHKIVEQWPPSMLLPLVMCQTRKMQIVYRQLRERFFLSTEAQAMRILEDMDSSGLLERGGDVRLRQTLIAEMLGISRVHLGTVLARVASQTTLSARQRAVLSMEREVQEDERG